MTIEDIRNLLKHYGDFSITICVRRNLSDEELGSNNMYPYPIETIDELVVSKEQYSRINNYHFTHLRGIPLEKIEFCDIGHSDKSIILETFIN